MMRGTIYQGDEGDEGVNRVYLGLGFRLGEGISQFVSKREGSILYMLGWKPHTF